MSNEVSQNITVSRDALYKVLHALVGPAHHIRELQATRSLHALGHPNPIETLIEQFNAGGVTPPAQEAPTAVAGPSEFPHEQMDAMALARYKVVPSTSSMFWSHAVVAGDGAQQLYVGREVECQNMVRKFAGAFLDGAFAFHSIAATPTTQQEAAYTSVQLAEMVLSDCGHSSNYKPLLERVAGRIDRHVERLLTAQQAGRALREQAAPAAVAGPAQCPTSVDAKTMELAESVGLIGPASRVHDLHAAIQRFHDLICANATIKAAVMSADVIRGAATSVRDYPPLPMQFACSGVFPVYSADQMRAYADATCAMRAQAAPAAVEGPSKAVAYLDIGSGGYLDLGSDLSDEALRKLPKGRHMLAIVGTYGVDGYVPVAAPTTQAAPKQGHYSGSTYAPGDSDIYERWANKPKEDGV